MPFQWSGRTRAPGATALVATAGSSLIIGSASTAAASAAFSASSRAFNALSSAALSSASAALSSATERSNAARAALCWFAILFMYSSCAATISACATSAALAAARASAFSFACDSHQRICCASCVLRRSPAARSSPSNLCRLDAPMRASKSPMRVGGSDRSAAGSERSYSRLCSLRWCSDRYVWTLRLSSA